MKKLIYWGLTIILVFIMLIFCYNFVDEAIVSQSQKKFLKSTNSMYITFYYGESDYNNEYYLINKYIDILYADKNLKCDVLMNTRENLSFKICNKTIELSKNEIAISKNLASKFNLKVGDSLTATTPFFDSKIEYSIKEIIMPVYGLLNDYIVNNAGIVLIGYNSDLLNTKTEKIAFLNKNERLNSVVLEGFIDISNYNSKLNKIIVIDFIFCFVILIACNLLSTFVMFLLNKFEIRKHIVDGKSIYALLKKYSISIIMSLIYSFSYLMLVIYCSFIKNSLYMLNYMQLIVLTIPFFSIVGHYFKIKILIRRI